MPLGLDHEEGVTGKERRPDLDPATVRQAALPDPWQIRHVTGQSKAMKRQPLAVRLEAGAGPVRHRITPPSATIELAERDPRAPRRSAGHRRACRRDAARPYLPADHQAAGPNSRVGAGLKPCTPPRTPSSRRPLTPRARPLQKRNDGAE